MLRLSHIKAVHLESSSHCAAGCPFCSRSQKKRPFPGQNISLEDFKLLPEILLNNLKRLTLGGNFGDLSCNPDLPGIMSYLRGLNPLVLTGGHSNGAVQDAEWWSELGASWGNGYIVFCIDGLADTHALYRKGTDFEKVITNLEAFIKAGGQAHWQFLVFEHNQHQIDQALKMARELGCARFFAMASRDYDDKLRQPRDLVVKHKRDHLAKALGRLNPEDRKALCKPLRKGSIYIAADGTVHPCCLAHCMYISEHNHEFDFIVPLIQRHLDRINFKTTPLEKIIAGPYFSQVFKESRDNRYCMKKCNRLRDQLKTELYVKEAWFKDGQIQTGGACG
jgi:MoaA/NifB/PqqE/SkfB family radical SAM enzyme